MWTVGSDSFLQDERVMMHAATALILLNLDEKKGHVSLPPAPDVNTRQTVQGKGKEAAAASAQKQEVKELHRILKAIMRLKLFEQPHRSNISWTSGRSHRVLAV